MVPMWNCSQQGLWIILSNWVTISRGRSKKHCCRDFRMYFLVLWQPQAELPCRSIIFKKRQTSLWPISPKLSGSHQNSLDGWITRQVGGEKYVFLILGWTAPLSQFLLSIKNSLLVFACFGPFYIIKILAKFTQRSVIPVSQQVLPWSKL